MSKQLDDLQKAKHLVRFLKYPSRTRISDRAIQFQQLQYQVISKVLYDYEQLLNVQRFEVNLCDYSWMYENKDPI